jgi:hypothetical protein
MATSKSDIEELLADGQQKGASHLIVVCDQFEYADYPVYVMPHESAKNSQIIMTLWRCPR